MSKIHKSLSQFTQTVGSCKSLFQKKHRDYGTSWAVMRPPSLTDQIYINACRIREILARGSQKVTDSVADEFTGIVNYCAMALILLDNQDAALESDAKVQSMEWSEVEALYDAQVGKVTSLFERKNHDYGDAWRKMRIESLIDIILMKILRIRHIEERIKNPEVSEGVDAGYQDILIYSIFALIRTP